MAAEDAEPVWLTLDIMIAIHEMQIVEHGGPPGVRDLGMLDSALSRPKNRWAYGERDLAALAAAYGFGVARNHPFVDGNKRSALMAIFTFLGVNDIDFAPAEADFAAIILALAAGEVNEEGLTRWISDNWPAD